jgi:hypothetical protein
MGKLACGRCFDLSVSMVWDRVGFAEMMGSLQCCAANCIYQDACLGVEWLNRSCVDLLKAVETSNPRDIQYSCSILSQQITQRYIYTKLKSLP